VGYRCYFGRLPRRRAAPTTQGLTSPSHSGRRNTFDLIRRNSQRRVGPTWLTPTHNERRTEYVRNTHTHTHSHIICVDIVKRGVRGRGTRYDTRHGVLILFSLETNNLHSIASQLKRLFDPTTIGILRPGLVRNIITGVLDGNGMQILNHHRFRTFLA